jgi:hypothetical protein
VESRNRLAHACFDIDPDIPSRTDAEQCPSLHRRLKQPLSDRRGQTSRIAGNHFGQSKAVRVNRGRVGTVDRSQALGIFGFRRQAGDGHIRVLIIIRGQSILRPVQCPELDANYRQDRPLSPVVAKTGAADCPRML